MVLSSKEQEFNNLGVFRRGARLCAPTYELQSLPSSPALLPKGEESRIEVPLLWERD